MTVEIEQLGPNALELNVDGMLRKEDYERFVPVAEHRIRKNGYLNLLINVTDLDGATAPAAWEDIKFDARHFRDIPRVAVVGGNDSDKQQWLAAFARPFTAAEIENYPAKDLPAARAWTRKGSPDAAGRDS